MITIDNLKTIQSNNFKYTSSYKNLELAKRKSSIIRSRSSVMQKINLYLVFFKVEILDPIMVIELY